MTGVATWSMYSRALQICNGEQVALGVENSIHECTLLLILLESTRSLGVDVLRTKE